MKVKASHYLVAVDNCALFAYEVIDMTIDCRVSRDIWIRTCMILLLALFTSSPAVLAAQANSAFDAGVRAYKEGSYAQAVQLLNSSLNERQNDLTHYYLALCYVGLNQKSQASSHYDWIIRNSTNATLKSYAVTGLQRFCLAQQGRGAQPGAAPSDPALYLITSDACGSLDCGPSTLAMVFKAFNKFPPTYTTLNPKYLVKATRLWLTGRDVQETTGLGQMESAAKRMGFKVDRFDGTEHIDPFLQQGRLVIVVGNMMVNGSYGKRMYMPDTSKTLGHYILVTGKSGDMYNINDVNIPKPFKISFEELDVFEKFLDGKEYGRCIAIGL